MGARGGARFSLPRARGGAGLIRELAEGDCFGEVALLDLGPRSASGRADVDSVALEIGALDLPEVAGRDPEQFALIYMNLGRELSRRLRAADERLFQAKVDLG